MRRLALILSTLALLTGTLASTAGTVFAASGPTSPYIVVFTDGVDSAARTGQLQSAFGFSASFTYSSALRGFAARLTAGQADALSRRPDIQFISPDATVTLSDTASILPGEQSPTGIRRIGAATSVIVHTASTVNVAVIDTGAQLTNANLNVVSGTNCISPGSQANDDNGHGTHVSGTIAGKNNGSSVPGVASGTTIYAVKVLNSSGSGSWSQIICGIDWVTANAAALNIKVANMSLGGSGSNDNNCGNSNFDAGHKAICKSVAAGVTYVIAAGNGNANFASSVPASYPEVLTVTAVTDSDGALGEIGGSPACRPSETDDRYASFSNFAVNAIEQNHTIAGPGVCILSDWLNSGNNTISGTSMATPHLTGAVALCLGQGGASGPCTGMTPAQIIQKMRSDAAARAAAVPSYGFYGDPQNPVAGRYYGNLVWVGGDLTPPPPPTIPGPPTLNSANGGNAVVTLGWSAPASTGGAAITGYNVYRGTSAGGESATPIATLGVVFTYNDPGVSNGTTYFYKVAAVNSVGAGGQSNERSALPQAPPTPGTLSGKVTNAANSGPIGGATVAIQGGSSTTTDGNGNYAFTNLAPATYSVTVTASGYTALTVNGIVVSAGTTTTGNFALNALTTAGPPGAPTLSAAGRGFSHGINLSWTVPASNGSSITGYRIYRAAASGGPFSLIANLGAVTAYTDTGNPSFRTSYYKILATNGNGDGPFSNVASAFSF